MKDLSIEDLDARFMAEAIKEARKAAQKGEVPVGCVIVCQGEVISRGHNLREGKNDPTAHAEIIAIRKAASRLKNWRLAGCTLYATIEPCPMCAGAIVLSRIDRVVYAVEDEKAGAVKSLYTLLEDKRLNHQVAEVVKGVREEEVRTLMRSFFKILRKKQV